MYRLAAIVIWFAVFLGVAPAQEQFPIYVGGLTAATTPFIGTEQLYMLQSGSSRRATLGNILGQNPVSTGACSGLGLWQMQVSTATPQQGQLQIFDGTQCVPLLTVNTSSHIPFLNGAPPGVVVVTQAPFNADNTGVADATTAIQAAINALSTGGGEVWFPQGTYKISSALVIGNGTSSAVSTRSGTVLRGIPNPTSTTAFTGYPGTQGPRLIWAGGTGTAMIAVVGPLMGWGIKNLALDCQGVASMVGIFVQSVQFGINENVAVNNCLQGIDENVVAPFGSVSNTNTFHNTWTNTSVSLSTAANGFGIFLTGAAAGTANTSFDQFINTTITFPTGTQTMYGIYAQVADTVTFSNTHIFGGGGNTGARCVGLDYSVNGSFPSALRFDGIENNSNCSGGSIIVNISTPGAAARANSFVIEEANGQVCPTGIANFVCQSSVNLTLGNATAGTAGQLNLLGSSSGTTQLIASAAGGLTLNLPAGTGTTFTGGTNAGTVFKVADAGSGAAIADGIQINGSVTTASPLISAVGTDTTINIQYLTKGASTTHNFVNNAAGGAVSVEIGNVGDGTGALVLAGNTSGTITATTSVTASNIAIDGPAPTCTFTTGGGTAPSCTVSGGSNGTVGGILATTGTGAPGSSGTITLTAPSSGWAGANGVACLYTLDASSGAWGNQATVFVSALTGTTSVAGWTNTASSVLTALATSTTYRIGYHCFGK